MTNIITGSFGCGKSTLIRNRITSLLRMGKEVFLIVPEQEAVDAECAITDACIAENVPSIGLEVLNFTRLCDRVFRTYGGLCYNYIGNGAKKIIMWRALSDLSETLTAYKNISLNDRNILSVMLNAADEFTRCGITPAKLMDAADELEKEESTAKLSQKLRDLALIYSSYSTLLHVDYDDPSEDQGRLCELLKDKPFFEGKYVFFDSFTSFTAVQLDIIHEIMRRCEECTFSLSLPDGSADGFMYTSLNKTLAQIKKISSLCGSEINITSLGKPVRFTNDELPSAGNRLWDFSSTSPISETEPTHIRVIRCGDRFSEAEECMRLISESVRNGMRYSDSIIVARDTSEYLGITDAMAEKYGVPCFISRRNEIVHNPVIRLVSGAFGIITSGWRRDDVISYIKTGLTGITADECDLLDGYASQWKISGSRWYDDDEWTMNPRGYTDEFDAKDGESLCRLNELRQRLNDPLSILTDAFRGNCTVKEGCIALFRYLEALDIRRVLEESNSEEAPQVWNLLINLLEQLNTTAGDATVNADTFFRLFSVMLDDADTGRIPASMDEVIFTDAMMLRSSGKKNVYILGANDGEFPKNVKDAGLFSDSEKITLEGCGIELSPPADTRSSDELYYFSRALTCVSDNVFILFHHTDGSGETKPSPAVERLCLLFPAMKISSCDSVRYIDRIISPAQSIELIPGTKYKDPVFSESLKSAYLSLDGWEHRIDALGLPLVNPDIRVGRDTADMLFGRDIRMSNSRLETYSKCAFKYYCQYVLSLSEQRSPDFCRIDTGIFIHRVLECFMKMIQNEDGSMRYDFTDAEIGQMIDDITDDYADNIFRGSKKRSKRILALFERLKRTTVFLVRCILADLAESDFTPAFFELPISDRDDSPVKPLRIDLGDTTGVYITGKVDRVDIIPHTVTKNGKVYVRVVDYKTGTKDFKIENIDYGLDLQMYLYLEAIRSGASAEFMKKIGGEDIDMIPAGVLYFPARLPKLKDKPVTTEEDKLFANALSEMKYSGTAHGDETALKAMERYNSVRKLSDFGEIMAKVNNSICRIAAELRSGRAEALPMKLKKSDKNCSYCPYKAVCRSAKE